jgi:hypothetical protein
MKFSGKIKCQLTLLCPLAGQAFHFWLDPKTKQKGQGYLKKVIDIFTATKFGQMIFEQVLSFLVSHK